MASNKPPSSPQDRAARPTVYLAGPEVFLRDAREIGEQKKRICEKYGLDSLFPLDVGLPAEETASISDGHNLFLVCIELMNRCDLMIANMTPFRGVSMDVGTAVELGYMYARGCRVFGYTNAIEDYGDRVESDDYAVERFGFADNLMCEGPIWRSNGIIIRRSVPSAELYTNLDGFEECVQHAARLFQT